MTSPGNDFNLNVLKIVLQFAEEYIVGILNVS
jgi:hypothetical protein